MEATELCVRGSSLLLCLMFSLLISVDLASAAQRFGINYGQIANNLPDPTQVAGLLRSNAERVVQSRASARPEASSLVDSRGPVTRRADLGADSRAVFVVWWEIRPGGSGMQQEQRKKVDPLTHQVKLCDFGSAKVLVLGTPTREEIRCMNPNYTEFRFPQIKAHPWHKVFQKRMPPEAIDLASPSYFLLLPGEWILSMIC